MDGQASTPKFLKDQDQVTPYLVLLILVAVVSIQFMVVWKLGRLHLIGD